MKFIFYTAIAFSVFSSMGYADNWPHWRGDNGNGVSLKAKPPTKWSDTENVKWKVAVPGRGSGSPVIWEDNVFIVTAVPGDRDEQPNREAAQPPVAERRRRGRGGPQTLPKLQFKLLCFDRSNGKLRWEKTAIETTPHQAVHHSHSFASSSPCTDGQHVYAHFGSRGLYCYTMDGELKWKRDDLGRMETRLDFGEGSSPTISGNKIIVPWDHEGQSNISALDKLTGQTIWKQDRDEPSCWSTPLIVDHAGKKQIVMNGENNARAYDLDTGKELWRCGGQTQRPIASAVAADGLVFVGSGYRGDFLGAFRLTGNGDIAGTKNVVWSLDRHAPDVASPLLSDGRIYFHKGKTGMISCVDAATGKPHYMSKRLRKLKSTYASPIAANGYVYLTGRSGTTIVIKDSDDLRIVATNSVGETVDATPAPVDNELFIRGEKHLFCIAE
jgi:outer membrane protein assembly factor BamB